MVQSQLNEVYQWISFKKKPKTSNFKIMAGGTFLSFTKEKKKKKKRNHWIIAKIFQMTPTELQLLDINNANFFMTKIILRITILTSQIRNQPDRMLIFQSVRNGVKESLITDSPC